LGLVLRAGIGVGEAFGGAAAVGQLSEDRSIAFPIRLEGDVSAIRTPNRIAVATTKGQPAQRRAWGLPVVHPDIRVPAIVSADSDLRAVRRQPRVHVHLWRQGDRLPLS